MKYLLDTHTAIWSLDDEKKLSRQAKNIIDNTSIPLFISIVSAWEIAVKISLGKLKFNGGSALFLNKMENNGVHLLGVNGSYIDVVERLPFIHRDPFDRLLVATAIIEDLTILTADENMQKYGISWCW